MWRAKWSGQVGGAHKWQNMLKNNLLGDAQSIDVADCAQGFLKRQCPSAIISNAVVIEFAESEQLAFAEIG